VDAVAYLQPQQPPYPPPTVLFEIWHDAEELDHLFWGHGLLVDGVRHDALGDLVGSPLGDADDQASGCTAWVGNASQ
jgi:hypothetical protein